MSDMYVYRFMRSHGPTGGTILSERRATLDAIKDLGEPLMESQIVVDHTEVNGNGFLIGGVDDELHPMDERWAQIRSLERRANSRDCDARQLDESTEGRRKYMLSLESRELRNQAQRLKKHRPDAMTDESGANIDAQAFANIGADPVVG
jgi:hypothetical protein